MDSSKIFKKIVDRFHHDTVYADEDSVVINGDSLELLKSIPSNSIALILTDPPYHSTKKKNIQVIRFFQQMLILLIGWNNILESGNEF